MTSIDLLIIGFVSFQAVLGFKDGFVKNFLQLLAILVSFRISMLGYPLLTSILQDLLGLSDIPSTIISFILIWISIFIIIRMIGFVLDKLIEFSGLSLINRVGGVIFGMGKGIAYLLPILIPTLLFKPSLIDNSTLLKPLKPIITKIALGLIPEKPIKTDSISK